MQQTASNRLNRVREQYRQGHVALGTYVTVPAPRAVEVLSDTGLDFVRFDPFRHPWPTSLLKEMAAVALNANLTPWARVGYSREAIVELVDCGMQIITVPEVDTAAQAKDIVSAVRSADRGDVLVGVQIETSEGIANLHEIIATDGVDIIHTGRTDISHAMGVPGEQFHPKVLEVERRIVDAALAAGKQVSLLYPLTQDGLALAAKAIAAGARIFALDMDYRILQRAFSDAASLRVGK